MIVYLFHHIGLDMVNVEITRPNTTNTHEAIGTLSNTLLLGSLASIVKKFSTCFLHAGYEYMTTPISPDDISIRGTPAKCNAVNDSSLSNTETISNGDRSVFEDVSNT